jgi:hypothetical protein
MLSTRAKLVFAMKKIYENPDYVDLSVMSCGGLAE